ncbi:MAG: helix-turn-helix domain-containing protein [Halarsenatibacteraceae bacterium]
MTLQKEKSLSDNTDRQGKENTINFIIPDRSIYINTLFGDLSGLIEIREIKEGSAKSLYFNNTDELIDEYDPPQDKNIYIGMMTRDKKRGQKQDTKQTQALWLDFDDVDDLMEIDYILDMKGLPTYSMAVDSGHGFHVYWLLDEPVGREVAPILRELARRTGADSKAAEIARIMRLPGTMNVKNEPVKCELVNHTDKKYKFEQIADILEIKPEADKEPKQADKAIGIDYEGIISEVDRPCIKSMLAGVEIGQRNWIQGRLIKYFKIKKGKSKKDTRKIIKAWNYRNESPLKEEELMASFNIYWKNNYNLLGCTIIDKDGKPIHDLQQILNKHCNKSDCVIKGEFRVVEGDSYVEYNNRLIKQIKELKLQPLMIYGVLAVNEQGLTVERAAEILGTSERTFKRNIEKLINLGFVKVKKGIKRRSIPDLYYLVRQGTFGTGRTIISYAAMRLFLSEIKNSTSIIKAAHFKLYMLLLHYKWSSPTGEVYPSTITLSEKLGCSRQYISKLVNELEEVDFMTVDRGKKSSNYYNLKIL